MKLACKEPCDVKILYFTMWDWINDNQKLSKAGKAGDCLIVSRYFYPYLTQ